MRVVLQLRRQHCQCKCFELDAVQLSSDSIFVVLFGEGCIAACSRCSHP